MDNEGKMPNLFNLETASGPCSDQCVIKLTVFKLCV